jgi:two-component system OmpR family response regulator
MRILVVEDEIDLCDTIAEGLQIDGYAVDKCYDGEEAYELIRVEGYDLVILDLNLPGMDGLDILREVRRQNKNIKVLILSARAEVSDKVLGLDMGANDYLAKPFAFEELEARLRSLLLRSFVQEDTILIYGALSLDTAKRSASTYGTEISLTKKELALLEYFLLNKEKVISQEELMEHVWDMEADSFSNAVRVHIASLRKKLKAAIGNELIHTKIGLGYYLSKENLPC